MDPFATLGIARTFDVDLHALEKTHRDLSRALHPDRFVAAGASERNLALERAVAVNESWRIVRDPVRRAEALFTLAGVPVGENHEPKPDLELLHEMLESREALEEAAERRDAGAVRAMGEQAAERAARVERSLSEGFVAAQDDDKKLAALVPLLGELRYCRRLLEHAGAIEERLTES